MTALTSMTAIAAFPRLLFLQNSSSKSPSPSRRQGGASVLLAFDRSTTSAANATVFSAPAPPKQQHQRRSVRRDAIKIDRSRQPTKPEGTIETDEDFQMCPVGCVREIKTQRELDVVLAYAARHDMLVVMDFYRTACGSCKYIEKGFAKLCRMEGTLQHPVLFLKHNVMDDYEEQSDIAEALRIKVVPLFHFYHRNQLVESFPTREKQRILETIQKYVPDFLSDHEDVAGANGRASANHTANSSGSSSGSSSSGDT